MTTLTAARARDYAITAQGDQKYGEHPYVHHLDTVHRIACEMGCSDLVKVAAFLHDVVEDTSVPIEEICNDFGWDIAALVYAVSNDTDPAPGYKERTYRKIRSHCIDAVALKLCDRIANMEACKPGRDTRLIRKYVSDMPLFRAILHVHDELPALWARLGEAHKILDEGSTT